MAYIIQYISSIFMILFSGLVTWYEGSELRSKPWEWEYSAVFSKIINQEVTDKADISSLDHFIYAAKFKPVYPILFAISLLYLVTLLAWNLLKSNKDKLVVFHFSLGVSLVMLSMMIVNSPTIGLNLFTWLFVTAGISSVVTAIVLKTTYTKRDLLLA